MRLARERARLREPQTWIEWVRLLAVPVVALEVAIERGNYPPGDERWAWVLLAVLTVGAVGFFAVARRSAEGRLRTPAAAGALAFDLGVLSAYVLIYSFEPGTQVPQILVLAVLEGALRFGRRGGVVTAVATVPAVFAFEWRRAERLDLYPFDAGHVVFALGLFVLEGLVVGVLVDLGKQERVDAGPPARGSDRRAGVSRRER